MSVFDEPKIDCHNHIFDPARFPYREDTVYRPAGQEIATAAQFKRVMDAYGVRHALLVGPTSGYRADNRCLLDAIAHGGGRFRGIAVVENDATLDQMAQLKTAGVVGVALNPAMEGVASLDDADRLFGMLAELDLFAQIQVKEDQLTALTALIGRTAPKILIDHCGRPNPASGLRQAGFQALLRLADSGRVTVKLSGLQKISAQAYPYRDAQIYARTLLERFGPEACIWGSDWPFLRAPERIDYGPLLKLAELLVPDPDARHRVMWETPMRLFQFAA
jgi:predicted TIM-barrel fold metal-dependent hydrolase